MSSTDAPPHQQVCQVAFLSVLGCHVPKLPFTARGRRHVVPTLNNNQVRGNLIGTDFTGTTSIGNSRGVRIVSSGNVIGGTTAEARNIISGNDFGVFIEGAATGNLIQGNYIGTDVTGTADLGNDQFGVRIRGPASKNTIGGTVGSRST